MNRYKKDFPIFKNNPGLVYLDTSATSQKPQVVIDALVEYYASYNANVRRGLYPLSEKATAKVEDVRGKVATFINARPHEIVFVRNATEAINLVAQAWGGDQIKMGDMVLTTIVEHHSNFVPWQQLAIEKNALFMALDIDNEYKFVTNNISYQNAKILAITHVSNTLGNIYPIKALIKQARKENPGIVVLVDAAQSVPHMKVDVTDLDADFVVFSGHKAMAGTGIGVLYGKKKLLETMQPFLYGGEMIREVRVEKTTWADIPHKFEAGTPAIADIISLGAAIDYLEGIGMEQITNYELRITNYALEKLRKIEGMSLYVAGKDRGGIISFNLDGVHAHDVAQVLGDENICIRSGHHCTMPLHQRLGIQASARASFAIYNDDEDVEQLVKGIKKVKKIFTV